MRPLLAQQFSLSLLAALLLASCSKDANISKEVFPEKPKGDTFFYNRSGIKDIGSIARMSIRRAKELSNIEFAMVFLDALPDSYSTESYAVELMDFWGIGERTNGRGVLFLFLEEQGEMKIEVSYELEPIFTDAFCKSYQDTIKTFFASRHFGDVVTNSINNMTKHYLGEPVFALDHTSQSQGIGTNPDEYLSGGAGIIERNYIYDKAEKLASIKSISQERIAQYAATESPHEAVENFLNSLQDGIGHPDIDVLTPGSRYMRIEYPKTADYLVRSYSVYADAMPYRILRKGSLSVARFKDDLAIPLMLVKCPDRKWRIDLPKSWGLSQGSYDFSTISISERIAAHPWEFAFPDQISSRGRINVDFIVPLGEDPAKTIEKLQEAIEANPEDARLRLELAKVLFWECYLILASIDEAEKAAEIDLDNADAHWQAIYARYRAPALKGIAKHYEQLMRLHPDDGRIKSNYEWFKKTTSE